MKAESNIYVAGHTGLVGSALVRTLRTQGYENLTLVKHSDLNLRSGEAVRNFFERHKPEYIFVAAARVGGIDANAARPVDFLLENVQIGTNIIACAATCPSTVKLLFLGSSCIYPRDCQQPIREKYLLTSPLEPSNQWYALAKITCLKLCEAYRRQYEKNFISVMPTNLYGPGDNYEPGCHVVPALIKRFHKAKENTDPVKVWGDGSIRREFLYADDLARACVQIMNEYNSDAPINVGYGSDISIRELAEAVSEVVGLRPERLAWDTTAPTGTPRKWLDSSKIMAMGWKPTTALMDGLKAAYQDFLKRNF